MKKPKSKSPSILNRQARREFHLIDKYVAGISLKGTEVKSIRDGKANLKEAYCYFKGEELFVRGMHISPYEMGNIHNPDPIRERKLLLKKKELQKLFAKSQEQGLTIIPVKLFFNSRNYAKLEIALAQGKKLHDKRHDIKERDTKKLVQRELNNY